MLVEYAPDFLDRLPPGSLSLSKRIGPSCLGELILKGSPASVYIFCSRSSSFPWNRPDLYVEQSPLFRADRITTPLLLLHGAADTNVPIGESEQLFVALELLGREVQMVEIEGQDHRILQYPKRQRWMKTILAWFDRELKDQPGWWEHLYPAEDGP